MLLRPTYMANSITTACEVMQDATVIVCNVNIKLQLSKIRRAVFQEKAIGILGKSSKVPEGDTLSFWNSMYKMNLYVQNQGGSPCYSQ